MSSASDCTISHIVIGDSTQVDVLGSSTMQLDDGHINDVILVPDISANLLLINQIYHYRDGKIVTFLPYDVVI